MTYYLVYVLGFIMGYVIAHIIHRSKNIGTIVINRSDPEYATFGFKFTKDANSIAKEREVVLTVISDDISQ